MCTAVIILTCIAAYDRIKILEMSEFSGKVRDLYCFEEREKCFQGKLSYESAGLVSTDLNSGGTDIESEVRNFGLALAAMPETAIPDILICVLFWLR
jgi:hypothetical protein